MKELICHKLQHDFKRIKTSAKWVLFSIVSGLLVGGVGTLFYFGMYVVTLTRTKNPWLIFLLPVSGILIVGCYRLLHDEKDTGTNLVLSAIHSDEDLPLRMGELGLVHRHEKSGQLHGLMRVRCFTQDDAHIFMTPEQIRDEIKGVAKLIDSVYQLFGFKYHVELSTRPEDSMGSDEDWEVATDGLRGALDDLGLDYVVNEGDGAFYGPKIDFHLEDSIGRTWQCGTIQVDFQMPSRLGAEYVTESNGRATPVMLHRAIVGSLERFIGMLLEHYAGQLPPWLAPVQVAVANITDDQADYAQEVVSMLKKAGLRAEADLRNGKITYKIRELSLQKLPYILVVGAKEKAEGKVAVRVRGGKDLGAMSVEDFIKLVQEDVATRRNVNEIE